MGSKPLVRPPRLAHGSRVALVAPAGPLLEQDDIARAEALCRALDYEPVLGAHARGHHGYFSGTDEERLADLNAAFRDPAIDAVWCLRGGYGVTRILDAIDFDALVRRPRPVIGYSDITALLAGVVRCAGQIAFHAPTARAAMPAFSRRHFARVLAEPQAAGPLEALRPPPDVLLPQANRVTVIHGGRADGMLAGGNLTLLHCLIGTRYFPDLDGALLFLEDVNEDLYRIDRMLAHLRMIGALARLRGVLVGRLTGLKRHMEDGSFGVDEVLTHYFAPLGVPVLYGVPIGHIEDQWTMPLGVRARIDADAASVELLEPAVA
ncbi:MAG TPA: LD-carboxypeptidase [Gemmatimonadales bacterium]|nr:LD-carboxypeptidase [Gemmatimonadales bacterium]